MSDEKLLITTLIGLTVATAAFCHYSNKQENTRENWWGGNPSMTWKVDREVARDQMAAKKGDFVSIPNFQAILEPRLRLLPVCVQAIVLH